MPEESEKDEKDFQWILKETSKGLLENSSNFRRAIMWASTVFLIASFTYVSSSKLIFSNEDIELFFISWMCFAGAIICTILLYFPYHKLSIQNLTLSKHELREGKEASEDMVDENDKLKRNIKILEVCAYTLFVTGIVLLLTSIAPSVEDKMRASGELLPKILFIDIESS